MHMHVCSKKEICNDMSIYFTKSNDDPHTLNESEYQKYFLLKGHSQMTLVILVKVICMFIFARSIDTKLENTFKYK